jgi:hypothetical protein
MGCQSNLTMSTDANRREFALIEAANAGDTAAAHALLDHLRDQKWGSE